MNVVFFELYGKIEFGFNRHKAQYHGRLNMNRMDLLLDAVVQAAQGDYSVRMDATDCEPEYQPLAMAINNLLETIKNRQTGNALKTSETFLNTIIERSPFPMWISDERGSLIRCNQALRDLLRITDDDVVGKYNIFHDNMVVDQGFLPLVQKVYEEGLRVNFVIRWNSKELQDPPIPVDKLSILDVTISPIVNAEGRVTNAVIQHIDITERVLAEEALRKSEERLSLAQRAGGIGLYDWDVVNDRVECNDLFFLVVGLYDKLRNPFSSEDWLQYIHPDDRVRFEEEVRLTLEEKQPYDTEFRLVLPGGSIHWISSKANVFYDEKNQPLRMIGAVADITPRKQAEEENRKLESHLRQAQKMESVGRLAGGVAHDFNNMLCVILGYTELLKVKWAADRAFLNEINIIEKAATHARDITRQLLAFSRKQIIIPKPIQMNDAIADVIKTLPRLIGEDIDLRFYPENPLWKINFDLTQFNQILLNLAVNARDAMPDGGKLTIETANIEIDEFYCRNRVEAAVGQYVCLTLADTGVGMDRETLTHIFEPFFTTKEFGKGTGLGLATVYGIVKQNGGFINVYSEPGCGASFKVYIPRAEDREDAQEMEELAPPQSSSGIVLLVEDNDLVRKMTYDMLVSLGYTALAAESPSQALALCESFPSTIDLLLTDVVMPEMNGVQLRDKILTLRPGVKVLFMSGYTSNVIVKRGVLEEGVNFLPKPFSRSDLAEKIRQAIGETNS